MPSSTFEMRVDINAQHLVMKWSQNYIAALGQFWDCLHLPSTHFVTHKWKTWKTKNERRENGKKWSGWSQRSFYNLVVKSSLCVTRAFTRRRNNSEKITQRSLAADFFTIKSAGLGHKWGCGFSSPLDWNSNCSATKIGAFFIIRQFVIYEVKGYQLKKVFFEKKEGNNNAW